MDGTEHGLPLGFLSALSQDRAAMEGFFTLTPEERRQVVEKSRRLRSRQEMRRLACDLRREKDEGAR